MKQRENPEKIDTSLDEFKQKVKATDLNAYFIFGSIILVLFIGLYAIFSPEAQNDRLANPACGKIVVASDGPTLNDNVSATLINAPYFLVVNPLSQKMLEVVKNQEIGNPGASANIAYLIAGKGEEAVIAGSINPTSYKILNQFGVRAFGGYSGNVRTAVDMYRQARIAQGPTLQPPQQPGQQVAFMQPQEHITTCPNCNMRYQIPPGMTNPICPHCGMAATSGSSQGLFPDVAQASLFDFATNSFQPNYRGAQQQQQGGYQDLFDLAAAQPNYSNYIAYPNSQVALTTPSTQHKLYPIRRHVPPPPIYSTSHLPHTYKGPCKGCHQIIQPPAQLLRQQQRMNTNMQPAAFQQNYTGRGTCVIR